MEAESIGTEAGFQSAFAVALPGPHALLCASSQSPGPADIQLIRQQPCRVATSLRVSAVEVACSLRQPLWPWLTSRPVLAAVLVSELAALGYTGPPAPPLSQPRAFDFFADCLLWLCQRCVGRLEAADRICKVCA